jgi:tRNA modification GTPase
MAELQIHGGRAVVAGVLRALAGQPGLRLAEPGEFSLRAFHNGRLDLTEAEGLADLIDAETDAQRRQAVAQAGGSLRERYDRWRAELLQTLALVEASLDFADEGDVPTDLMAQAKAEASNLEADIRSHLEDGRHGEIIRDGLEVVIAGPPNAGKSTLMNALARRDVAIVSTEAGTTRDVIEVRLDVGGHLVRLVDTAGLREAEGTIEREGIRRTRERLAKADVVLWTMDATDPIAPGPELTDDPRVIPIVNKSDLLSSQVSDTRPKGVLISAATGEGVDRLLERLGGMLSGSPVNGGTFISRERHRLGLMDAAAALRDALAAADETPELLAEDLRRAAYALGRVTGRVDVEDILDRIFGSFCIGK